MNKLSLYDLFSFALPGFVSIVFIKLLSGISEVQILENIFSIVDNEIAQGLMIIVLSFVIGSVIHGLTFYLIELSLYRYTGMYQSVGQIVAKAEIDPVVMAALDADCRTQFNVPCIKRQHGQSVFSDSYYSFIYFTLEVANKISAPKAFQSFYFFFRNLFTIQVMLIIAELILLIFDRPHTHEYLCAVFASLLLGLLCIVLARWHRIKMVDRIIWCYFCYLKIKNTTHDKTEPEPESEPEPSE